MSVQGIRIRLGAEEIKALERLAEAETRPLSMQAQHLILEALRQKHMIRVPIETQPLTAAVTDASC